MIKYIYSLSLIFLCFNIGKAQFPQTERPAVLAVIDSFFVALNSGDSAAIAKTLAPNASLRSLEKGKINTTPIGTFIMAIGMKPRRNEWKEVTWTKQVHIDGELATVWTDYSFFLDGNLSHCGANHFLLTKDATKGWLIHDIMDTRRTENCATESMQDQAKKDINSLMDNWHKAAATADEDLFFAGSMTEDGIYLGTDITERWLRDELKKWAKSAFDRDVAWAFTAKDRVIYFNENDPNIAWLEESLDTWMGPCRGSAVVMRVDGVWKIKHYNLAVAVANEVVEKYMKLIGMERKK